VTGDLAGRSVAVVGASSGIGRAAALAFADHGCRLVLAARSVVPLRDLARECEARGAEVVVVVADTADAQAVDLIATTAVAQYGVLDAWVHAAAGIIAGRLGDESEEELRRLVDVDVLGYLHGSRAALGVFRRQGHGTLVNVGSMLGVVTNPAVPTYVMSKFAITGLTRALVRSTQSEPGIHVCLVLPGPVDTPLFQRAANHTGRQLRAIPPAVSPERVAATVVRCVRRPRPEVPAGGSAWLIQIGRRFAPRTADRVVAAWSGRLITRGGVDAPATTGALFDVSTSGRVDGGWRRVAARRALGDWWGRTVARHGAHATANRTANRTDAVAAAVTGARTAEGPE
jgi:NAD(P)-dependent dehydrogenase (short-subunit alcohol dehydrogenase family)